MKDLFLARHAKSSWDHPTLSDHERPLNERGLRDAPMMAARLSQRGVCPDLILTSTAKRARTTARLLAEEIGYDQVSIVADDRIYGASASEQLQVIRSTDDARTSLMLIGHNPYITELANRLGRRHIFNMPTCGILHLHINTDIWTEVGEAPVDEGFYDFPKR